MEVGLGGRTVVVANVKVNSAPLPELGAEFHGIRPGTVYRCNGGEKETFTVSP